jgi:hypothetical protein
MNRASITLAGCLAVALRARAAESDRSPRLAS